MVTAKIETCLFCGKTREMHDNAECGEIRGAIHRRVERAVNPPKLRFEEWLYQLLGVANSIGAWVKKSQNMLRLWESPFHESWVRATLEQREGKGGDDE